MTDLTVGLVRVVTADGVSVWTTPDRAADVAASVWYRPAPSRFPPAGTLAYASMLRTLSGY